MIGIGDAILFLVALWRCPEEASPFISSHTTFSMAAVLVVLFFSWASANAKGLDDARTI